MSETLDKFAELLLRIRAMPSPEETTLNLWCAKRTAACVQKRSFLMAAAGNDSSISSRVPEEAATEEGVSNE